MHRFSNFNSPTINGLTIPRAIWELIIKDLNLVSLLNLRASTRFFHQLTFSHLLQEIEGRCIEKIILTDNANTFFQAKNGDVWACGNNKNGELGIPDFKTSNIPLRILQHVRLMFSDGESTFFLMKNGAVRACGLNDEGQLGLGDKLNRAIPEIIPHLENVTNIVIDSTRKSTLFFLADGSVLACGQNNYGQMDFNTPQVVPKPISHLTNVKSINANIIFNRQLLFLYHDGRVSFLSAGSVKNSPPIFLTALKDIQTINSHFCFNKLGEAYSITILYIVSLGNLGDVSQICSNYFGNIFLLKGDGTVMVEGTNRFGQIGIPGVAECGELTLIPGLTDVVEIVTDYNRTYFLKKDGSNLACGATGGSQLPAEGGLLDIPIPMPHLNNVRKIYTKKVNIGDIFQNYTFYQKNDGCIYVYGFNKFGQLGIEAKNVVNGEMIELDHFNRWQLAANRLKAIREEVIKNNKPVDEFMETPNHNSRRAHA